MHGLVLEEPDLRPADALTLAAHFCFDRAVDVIIKAPYAKDILEVVDLTEEGERRKLGYHQYELPALEAQRARAIIWWHMLAVAIWRPAGKIAADASSRRRMRTRAQRLPTSFCGKSQKRPRRAAEWKACLSGAYDPMRPVIL